MFQTFVFFIYGLAFFALGFSLLLYPRRGSSLPLAGHLWLLAAFGLLHGANEWFDMFLHLAEPGELAVLQWLRLSTLPGSFLFLFGFGAALLARGRRVLGWLIGYGVAAVVAVAIIAARSAEPFLMADVASRYLLGAPGALLAGLALLAQSPTLRDVPLRSVRVSAVVGAGTFFVYAVAAGLVVPEARCPVAEVINYRNFAALFGFPIQLLRAACALVTAVSMIWLLRAFRWEAQRRLHESEVRFRTVARAAPLVVFITDREGAVGFADGKGLEAFGEGAGLAGQSFAELFTDPAAVGAELEQVLAGSPSRLFTAERGDRVFEVLASPWRQADDRIAGTIGVALDVTERSRTRDELEAYRGELASARRLAELGALATAFARQVSEPLTMTRLLIERMLSDSQHAGISDEMARTVNKGFTEVTRAVAALDDFSRSARIGEELPGQPIDIYPILRRIIRVFADRARQAQLAISLRDLELVPIQSITARELEQIFFILVQDVVDAAGAGPASLVISGDRCDGLLCLKFADSFRHFSDRQIERFFDPLGSGGQASAKSMGLAIAQGIVASHGGRVDVTSGQSGTTVAICLPAV